MLSAIADAALRPRPVWGSPRAYVIAMVVGIIGLGNIWRFPYMVGLHGGGSFVLAYLTCVVLFAVPVAILESGAGNLARRSPVGLFRRAAGRWGTAIGWAVIALTVGIMSYYFVITGWTLGYTFDAILGTLSTFDAFTSGMTSLWLLLIVGAGIFVLLLRDVAAIERSSLFVMPLLLAIVVGLAIYAQTLDGAGEARSFYFGIDGSALLDTATWRAALGQAFYSLGVGQGILIAYGSFVPAGTNIPKTTGILAVANSSFSIIAGLMVFPMVFTFGIAPDSGSQLSFTAFPRAFEQMGAAGVYLAIAFFTLLFVAAFSSCLSGTLVVLSTLREELGVSRRGSTWVAVAVIVIIGVPSALSFTDVGFNIAGVPFLDRMDQLTGAGILVAVGLVGGGVIAWRLPRRRLLASFHAGRLRRDGGMQFRVSWIVTWAGLVPFVAAALFLVTAIVG